MYGKTPRLNSIRTAGTTYAANDPILRIAYSRAMRPGEVLTKQPIGATIQASADGAAGGSYLRVTVTESFKDMSGAVTTEAHNIDGDVVETAGGLVDALNALDGITAWLTSAPHSLATNTNTWTALTETQIPESPGFLDCLQRSVVTSHPVYIRLGEPTERDAGFLRLMWANVAIGNATGGFIEVGQDRKGEDYKKYIRTALTATADTRYFNYDDMNAPTLEGPLLVTVGATNLTGTDVTVATQQANVHI